MDLTPTTILTSLFVLLCAALVIGYVLGKRSKKRSFLYVHNESRKLQETHSTESAEQSADDTQEVFSLELATPSDVSKLSTRGIELAPMVSESLLHLIPSGLNYTNGQVYKLIMNPEVASEIRQGGLQLAQSRAHPGMIRSFVRDGKKIRGHGSLAKVGSGAKMVAASFQVVSFVVGQAHLKDIGEKLKSIEDKLSRLLDSVSNEQQTRIRGNVRYMQTIANTVLSGTLADTELSAYTGQLEAIERDFLQLDETLKIDADRLKCDIKDLVLDRPFETIESDQKKLTEKVQELDVLSTKVSGLLRGRAGAIQLQRSLAISSSTIDARTDQLLADSDLWKSRVTKLRELTASRAWDLKGAFFRSKETENELRSKVLNKSQAVLNNFEQESNQVAAMLQALSERDGRLNNELGSQGIVAYVRQSSESNSLDIVILDD